MAPEEPKTDYRINTGFAVDLRNTFPTSNHGYRPSFLSHTKRTANLSQLNGQNVGSALIAQNFTSPIFFQTRNETASPSASGVDPDITLQQAYSQIPGISNATGIPVDSLTNIVNQNQQGTLWIFGSPYVDPLQLNLLLIKDYPSVYGNFTG